MDAREVDVVVVGAGFAGLYLHHRLRGAGFSVAGFEAGTGVGGTWYWNRYPGARCDVESLEYSYSFDEELEQEWDWSERYATQPEILRYLEHVADRFDLRRDITFEARVESATWDETTSRWTVRTDTGETVSAAYVVMATGCLSSANVPSIPGLDSFAGRVLHTGQWPHEPVDFTGQRVGVIGTGSSGIQSIPVIAEQADHLTVFQRTPNYSIPAHNRALDPDEVAEVKADYRTLRDGNKQMPVGFGFNMPVAEHLAMDVDDDERARIYEERWARGGLPFLGAFLDLALDSTANETAADFVRDKIRGLVDDPDVAELLAPRQVIGCKRMCVDTGYYATFNRPNVRLVDIASHPIVEITATSVRTETEEVELDTLVLATGFDAMTGAVLKVDFRGVGGASMQDEWSAGPRTLLGLGVPKFPNLFLVTGPGSPSVLTNMVTSIEQHVDWITRCLEHLRAEGIASIEAKEGPADEWVAYVNMVAGITLFTTCNSWYLGANVPGKPRIFMPLPGFPPYAEHCEAVAANGYDGFQLTPA